MVDSSTSVGLLYDGMLSGEQAAALEWLCETAFVADRVRFENLRAAGDGYDVLWWHRNAPSTAPRRSRETRRPSSRTSRPAAACFSLCGR